MGTMQMIKALGIATMVAFAACGGDRGDSSTTTEIRGNLAERTASTSPARERPSPWWRALPRFVGVAYAHGGLNGLDVCAETCPSGLDASGQCSAPQATGFCSQTDGGGNFTIRGDMSGDLCVRLADEDTPEFSPMMCVRGVPAGARVTMGGMSCSHGSGTCSAGSVEMEDRMGGGSGMG